jgi:integrase
MIDAGNSRRYVNENVHRIRKVFRWAASEQLVSPTVFQALNTVEGLRKGHTSAREGRTVVAVSDEVVDATIPYLSPVVADMVRLQRLTGSRPGEICALRPCDLDRSGQVWTYVPAEHKTEHLGREFKVVEESLGKNTLVLVVASAYLKKLLDNARIVRFLSQKQPEILTEFQKVVESRSLAEQLPE